MKTILYLEVKLRTCRSENIIIVALIILYLKTIDFFQATCKCKITVVLLKKHTKLRGKCIFKKPVLTQLCNNKIALIFFIISGMKGNKLTPISFKDPQY